MKLSLIILGLSLATFVQAKTPEPDVIDSIQLQGVTLYSDYKKFQPGAKIDRISAQQMQIVQEGSLEQTLSRFSPIYIKGNAGGLSSIRFRGTSANHTSINMGGLNINSLTLGSSNASNIPIFLFDGINLQYGSSSAINGTGAVGGTVYLEQSETWTNGQKLNLTYSKGSFGENFYGGKLYLGNGKWESVTKIYQFKKENNFPFENPDHENHYTDPTPVTDTQKGAAINNKGLLQQINCLLTPTEFIKTTLWFENTWHQVQPNMSTNAKFTTTEELENNNLRFWSQYTNNNQGLKYQLGAGYVHDQQLYNKDDEQLIITDRLVTEGSIKQAVFGTGEYKFGAKYKYIVPDVYSYLSEVIQKEQHLDLYFSYFFEPVKDLKTTINLRQMFVTNFKAPFTPALITEYLAARTNNALLSINAGISRSYRIPTFNDRYWGTQGNPNLEAEDGFNLEGGFNYFYQKTENHYKIKLNLFYMDINNWIEWRNFGKWQAQNIQRVISKGAEVQLSGHFHIAKTSSNLNLNYTYNPVKKKEDITTEVVNKQQLIYAPLHMGNIYYQLNYKKVNFFTDMSYTGERYTDYEGNKLPFYIINNAGLSHSINYKQLSLNLSVQMHNIFNVQYQNEIYYAMPGRSYKLSLSIDLNNKP